MAFDVPEMVGVLSPVRYVAPFPIASVGAVVSVVSVCVTVVEFATKSVTFADTRCGPSARTVAATVHTPAATTAVNV